jgi:hypothetical protein
VKLVIHIRDQLIVEILHIVAWEVQNHPAPQRHMDLGCALGCLATGIVVISENVYFTDT